MQIIIYYGYVLQIMYQKKRDNDDGVKMYEEYLEQRKTFIYNSVKVVEDDVIKYDYNVLQEV